MHVLLRSFVLIVVLSHVSAYVPPKNSGDQASDTSLSQWIKAFFQSQFLNDGSYTSRIIGGQAIQRPCCTSMKPRRIDCFILTPDYVLMHQIIEGNERKQWEHYPFSFGMVESFTCLSTGNDRIDILYVDRMGVLHAGWYADGEFDEEKQIGAYVEAPSCTMRRPGVLDCLVRNVYNRLYHVVDQDGQWHVPVPVDTYEVLKAHPVCYPRTESRLLCLGSSYQNKLLQGTYDAEHGWGEWDVVDEAWSKSKPFLTAINDKMLAVVHGLQNDYAWLFIGDPETKTIGGHFVSDPECILSPKRDRVHCFGIGLKTHLYHSSVGVDGVWIEWEDLGGAYTEQPSCAVYDEKTIACYLRGFNKDIIEVTYRIEE